MKRIAPIVLVIAAALGAGLIPGRAEAAEGSPAPGVNTTASPTEAPSECRSERRFDLEDAAPATRPVRRGKSATSSAPPFMGF